MFEFAASQMIVSIFVSFLTRVSFLSIRYQHKNSFEHHFCSGHFQKTFSFCLVLCNTIRDWILNLCQNIHVLKPATAIAAAIPALAARMNIVLTWVFFRFLKHWMSCKNRCSHKIFFPFQISLFTTAAAALV